MSADEDFGTDYERLKVGPMEDSRWVALAAATADSTSFAVHCGARAITSPVDGLKQSIYVLVLDVSHSPFTQYFSFLGCSGTDVSFALSVESLNFACSDILAPCGDVVVPE